MNKLKEFFRNDPDKQKERRIKQLRFQLEVAERQVGRMDQRSNAMRKGVAGRAAIKANAHHDRITRLRAELEQLEGVQP